MVHAMPLPVAAAAMHQAAQALAWVHIPHQGQASQAAT